MAPNGPNEQNLFFTITQEGKENIKFNINEGEVLLPIPIAVPCSFLSPSHAETHKVLKLNILFGKGM